MKRVALLLLLLPACHRKVAPPTPASAVEDATPSPASRQYAESSGTLLIPPPKPKAVRPPPVEEAAPRAKAQGEAPAPMTPPPVVEGTRLPLWKQRAKFY
jgi:hypothetical protein